ncbi:Kelch repeat-containing protein [Streptomyces vietnamensis]|uniref:Kelch repeat-containing protein n=1 Tax=Streptomyces vietnamensis TaxID=362257 RepID=UPI000695A858|nr:kelch repeat-containing protein [Streptomyces vietnamensis]
MRTLVTDGGDRPPPATAVTGHWAPAGTLPVPLVYWHGQYEGPVTLHDGRVLAAGGAGRLLEALADAAVFDPASGTWTETGRLHEARRIHSLTVLRDGRVLAAGGITGPQAFPPSAVAGSELYDPEAGTWTPAAPMAGARYGHSATLLPDGRVLVAGGNRLRDARTVVTLTTAELFDPDTGTWSPAAEMADARWHHIVAPLPGGHLLAVAGLAATGQLLPTALALCEVYDPRTDSWAATGALRDARYGHQAVPLPDGTVLAMGGGRSRSDDARFDPYGTTRVERYDPETGTWYDEQPLPWTRSHPRALPLPSGEVLVFGGADEAALDVGFPSALRFDPVARRWSPAGPLRTGRWAFGATSLADGRVLAAGGVSRAGSATAVFAAAVGAGEAEVFTP